MFAKPGNVTSQYSDLPRPQVINVAWRIAGAPLEVTRCAPLGRSHLAHTIDVDPDSELGVRPRGKIRVNSLHHQASRPWRLDSSKPRRGEDGTVEGAGIGRRLIVAVQCHPEELAAECPGRASVRALWSRARGAATERPNGDGL